MCVYTRFFFRFLLSSSFGSSHHCFQGQNSYVWPSGVPFTFHQIFQFHIVLSAVLLLLYICSSAASLETRCCQFEETGRGSSESSSYINLVAPIGHFVLVPQRNTRCQSVHLFAGPWCLFSRDDLLVVQSVSIGNPPGKFNFDLGCLCVTTARSRQVLLLWGSVCTNALCPFLIVLLISRSSTLSFGTPTIQQGARGCCPIQDFFWVHPIEAVAPSFQQRQDWSHGSRYESQQWK